MQNFTFTVLNPIADRWLNETRVGVARMRLHRRGERANGADLVTLLGVPGVGFGGSDAFGLSRFDIQGFSPIGDSLLGTPCEHGNTNIQIGERLTLTEGRHSIRVRQYAAVGHDYRRSDGSAPDPVRDPGDLLVRGLINRRSSGRSRFPCRRGHPIRF